MKRRFGKIVISRDIYEDDRVIKLFDFLKLIPYRVEFLAYLQSFEIIGVSEYFDETEEALQAPEYEIIHSITDNKHTFKVRKI